MTYFGETHYQSMLAARARLHDVLAPAADDIAATVPSFEGLTLFQADAYHTDSAGTIVQINPATVPSDRLTFQQTHITNRRVDLEVSALGETFATGTYELAESRMNPEQQLVAGFYIPEQVGKRAASVVQLAFNKHIGEPTRDQLDAIAAYWTRLEPACHEPLETLYEQAALFPTHSVADALELDVPTTPNAFVLAWDTSGSRGQAATHYGKLRSDLALRGQRFEDIITAYEGYLLQPTGDGQLYALDLPVEQVNRLSDASIAQFASHALLPLVKTLLDTSRADGRAPLRWTVDLGRIERTTFETSSPVIFENATTSDRQPHDRTTVAFGERARRALALETHDIDMINQ